jgi:hypothetical protein
MGNFIVKQEGPNPRAAEKVLEVRLGTGSVGLGRIGPVFSQLTSTQTKAVGAICSRRHPTGRGTLQSYVRSIATWYAGTRTRMEVKAALDSWRSRGERYAD